MAKPTDNFRKLAFAEAVSLDFWHDAFGKEKEVGLYADVVFGTARVGGEAASSVRFRLRIRQADVVLVLPETEPVQIVKSSLARASNNPKIKEKIKSVSKRGAKANLGGGLSIDPFTGLPDGYAKVDAGINYSIQVDKTFEMDKSDRLARVTLARTAEGNYCWSIKSGVGAFLDGRPWDVVAGKPHAILSDERKNLNKGIEPAVYMEVRCRREDIEIFDIEIKNEAIWAGALEKIGVRNRTLAAEAYIRTALCKEGLSVENISDKFGKLTFCVTSASPKGT